MAKVDRNGSQAAASRGCAFCPADLGHSWAPSTLPCWDARAGHSYPQTARTPPTPALRMLAILSL